jgi:hypothetical protein
MWTALVPHNASGAMPLASEKTFERHKQIRSQTSLLAPYGIQISVFEQARKKILDQVLRFLPSKAVPPDKSIERSPISTAECFQSFARSGRFALRLQHNAPMSGGKGHSATIGAFDGRGTVHDLMLHASVAFG